MATEWTSSKMALWTRWDARKRWGMALVLTVAAVWVASSFVVQSLEDKGIAPLLLTYIANSLFVLYLPMHGLVRKWKSRARAKEKGYQEVESGSVVPKEEDGHGTETMEIEAEMTSAIGANMSDKDLAWAALKISPIWFAAQFTFNASLMSTSVTSNTILSSSSNMFTFLLAVLLIGEAFTVTKLASISTVILGIAAVAIADARPTEGSGSSSIVGDVLCLVSAFCYGLYTVVLRKELADDERVSMTFFFGCVGLFNMTMFFPVLLMYRVFHPAIFQVSGKNIWLCIAKGLFDNVLSDYLWARAVLLLGPTLATVGLSLQVPMAIVAEILFGRAAWIGQVGRTFLTFLGGALVLGGFFGLQREELVDEAYL